MREVRSVCPLIFPELVQKYGWACLGLGEVQICHFPLQTSETFLSAQQKTASFSRKCPDSGKKVTGSQKKNTKGIENAFDKLTEEKFPYLREQMPIQVHKVHKTTSKQCQQRHASHLTQLRHKVRRTQKEKSTYKGSLLASSPSFGRRCCRILGEKSQKRFQFTMNAESYNTNLPGNICPLAEHQQDFYGVNQPRSDHILGPLHGKKSMSVTVSLAHG